MTRVAICSPCTDTVQSMWAHDYAMMLGCTIRSEPSIELAASFMPGSLIPQQREDLVLEVLRGEFTHILWLDTDMRFPPDTLLRMLEREKRIVAANYVQRRKPFRPVTYPSFATPDVRLFTEVSDSGLVAVDAVGFGCVLTVVDVFKKLPEPWFAAAWVSETQEFVSEDVYFCRRAREAGEQIWIDHDLSQQVYHIGTFPFAMVDALARRATVCSCRNNSLA